LIRHAEVENPHSILYGHLPGFPLSSGGRAQARAVGERLRDSGLAAIAHSPLERAQETAELIRDQLATPVDLVPETELREADFSRQLQGLPYWQVPLLRPLWFVHKARRGLLPGDESIPQMAQRLLDVAYRLAREHPGRPSALVSHRDVIQAVWVVLEGRPQNELELYRKSVDRAGTLELTLNGSSVSSLSYVPPPQVANG
jgi:broad specificity phosphatase PhoE